MNWNQIVSDIGPRLFRYFSTTFSSETASDLTQETLIRLVKRVDQGEHDEAQGSLVMYAYGIARLVRLEAWKKQAPEVSYGDPKDYDFRTVSGSANEGGEDHVNQLRTALNELPEIQKQIVLLHVDEELTLLDISDLVGVPLNTVKSHLRRAKKSLKNILKIEGEDHE